MSKLRPDMQVKRIFDINTEMLWEKGIRGMVFDLDNTITPWHIYDPDEMVSAWFEEVIRKGFKVCILSNSSQDKVDAVCSWLGITVIGGAGKPFGSGFDRACKKFELAPGKIAMVGDQLFTDMLGGNRAGFYTILTEPIAKEEFWGTKNISRRMERIVKHFWRKNNI